MSTFRPQVAALLCAVTPAIALPLAAHAQRYVEDVRDVGYVLGDTMAPMEIVEFGDFACSACGRFWRLSWPRVKAELIETGRVRWRHVPFLIGFARGDAAAAAAECAGEQGSFWAMHDSLFARQDEWLTGRDHRSTIARYADGIGLDPARFRSCLDDETRRERTRAANRTARRARIRGTPTFFIDGQPAVGALPFEAFLELVRAAEERREKASRDTTYIRRGCPEGAGAPR